jgi:hypothetical protein
MNRLLLLALLPAITLAEPVWVGRFVPAQGEPPPPWRIVRFDTNIPPDRKSVV